VKRIPRPLRLLCLVAGGWLALFLAVNLVILLSGVAARWAGKDPRAHDDHWPDITNLRVVGDRLLIGGETSPEQYRELAGRDVTLVIDMRTGGSADMRATIPSSLPTWDWITRNCRSRMAGRRHWHRFGDFLTWLRPRTAGSSLTAGAEWVVPPPSLRPTRQPRVRIPRCWNSSPLDRQPSSRSGSWPRCARTIPIMASTPRWRS
jgi:hypothetical protein